MHMLPALMLSNYLLARFISTNCCTLRHSLALHLAMGVSPVKTLLRKKAYCVPFHARLDGFIDSLKQEGQLPPNGP